MKNLQNAKMTLNLNCLKKLNNINMIVKHFQN